MQRYQLLPSAANFQPTDESSIFLGGSQLQYLPQRNSTRAVRELGAVCFFLDDTVQYSSIKQMCFVVFPVKKQKLVYLLVLVLRAIK